MGKLYCLIAISFFLSRASAQSVNSSRTDKLKSFVIANPKEINEHDKPTYILDGKIYEANPRSINPNNILEIIVLKDSVVQGMNKMKDEVIIITKSYAQIQYKSKLSNYCEKYKNYLKANRMCDSNLTYILNGIVLQQQPKDGLIKTLYDNTLAEIKSVDFMEKYWQGVFNNNNPIIVVTTKK